MASSDESHSGTLGVSAYFTVPHIPLFITEWSALFPLICHLANYGQDYQMVGELTLAGHFTVGLFSRLGHLNGIWRLLDSGTNFLDRANNKDETRHRVWDVNWGSVFTGSNGAAISMITKYALRNHLQPVRMPQTFLADPCRVFNGHPASAPSGDLAGKVVIEAPFRRYQTLHVSSLSRKLCTPPGRGIFYNAVLTKFWKIAYTSISLGMAVVFCLTRAYGSAIVVLCGLVTEGVCRLLRVERPAGHLDNNEYHEACILSAARENASTWYLHIDDRGVVDWVLNKSMLSTPSAGSVLTACFRFTHLA